jgi:phosphomevalonate kinase
MAKTAEESKKPELNWSRSRSIDSNELPSNLPLSSGDDESKTKSTPILQKFGKKTEHKSTMGNKDSPK